MNKMIKRLKCKHEQERFVGAVNVYADLWGYDHTKFTFECIECGMRKRIKTHHPDIIWNFLIENDVL